MLTPDELAAIAARAERLPRKPWTIAVGSAAKVVCADGRSFNFGDAIYHDENVRVATFVAGAIDDIPALLAHIAEVTRQRDAERDALLYLATHTSDPSVAPFVEQALERAGLPLEVQ